MCKPTTSTHIFEARWHDQAGCEQWRLHDGICVVSKLVKPVAMCRRVEPASASKESTSVTNENGGECRLNGMTEGEDTEIGPEGDEDECEVEPTDWKVRIGPRNNLTQKEREREQLTCRSETGAHTA